MRKTKFLAIALVGLMAVVSGCSKDDEKKVDAPDSLVNTSWLYETKTSSNVEVGIELNFESTTKFNIAVVGADDEATTMFGELLGEGTYTYNKPTVTIKLHSGETATGTIDGKKLSLKDKDGETTIFTQEEEDDDK